MLRFAFNTNGCTHHRLGDALELIAEAGYAGVALTVDVPHFDPFADGWEAAAEALGRRLADLDLGLVVMTGAPYLLDPRDRFEPTLLHPDADGRARRVELLTRAISLCAIAGGEGITLFAGRPRRTVSRENAGAWLLDGLTRVANAAAAQGVVPALAAEPGHMVARLDDFVLVRDAVRQFTDAPLHLALDLGHRLAVGDRDPRAAVKEFAPILGSVTLADGRRGSTDRPPLGEGDLDVTAALTALEEVGYERLVVVERPRDGAHAADAIPATFDFVQDRLPSD